MYEEEKLIDIKDMLYRVSSKWRSICIIGLVVLFSMLLIKFPVLIYYIKKSQSIFFIKMLLQYGGLSFVLGIALAFFFYIVSYILTDKIYLTEDLSYRFKINLIGYIPPNIKKKKIFPDYLINKIFDRKISGEMQESLLERAAEEIGILVTMKDISCDSIPVIALVSSYSAEVTAQFEEQIEKKLKKHMRLVNAGNILHEARSVRMVKRADLVIIVEKEGRSTCKQFKETCRKLSLWKKDILGIVLLDVV